MAWIASTTADTGISGATRVWRSPSEMVADLGSSFGRSGSTTHASASRARVVAVSPVFCLSSSMTGLPFSGPSSSNTDRARSTSATKSLGSSARAAS